MAKPVLGRGLGALLGGESNTAASTPKVESSPVPDSTPAPDVEPTGLRTVSIDAIAPSKLQPRRDFDEEALRELSASIAEQGIIQPLIVRERDGKFELVAGERRWRASKMAGLTELPVIVRENDDETTLELMLIENLQREDLNAIEESLGYSELAQNHGLTQDQIATKVGKSRTAVANALRLLKLSPEIQKMIRADQLSVGHAKVILGLVTHSEQNLAAERVVRDGLTVRQTEEMIAQWGTRPSDRPGKKRRATAPDAHIQNIENQVRERVGTRVNLKYRDGKGSLEIKFFNDDDLNRVLDVLGIQVD